jgi:hypothetical protein
MNPTSRRIQLAVVLLLGLVISGFLFPRTTHAASLTSARPTDFSDGTPPPYTVSWYKTTTSTDTAYTQGCTAAQQSINNNHAGLLTIYALGEPVYRNGEYGTKFVNVSNVYASDTQITQIAKAFVDGAGHCDDGYAKVRFGIGTSNYAGALSSTSDWYNAGKAWGNMVNTVADYAAQQYPNSTISVYGADDIEVDVADNWATFAQTKQFVDGFNAAQANRSTKALFINFGDDPNGTGTDGGDWNANAVWYVSTGAGYNVVALPEIYFKANAAEWVALDQWSCNQKGSALNIFGTMTQNGFDGSYSNPGSAWQEMYNELSASSNSCVNKSNHLYYSTDIRS